MAQVYLAKNINQILEQINFSRLGENVGIKVHFGEKGCNTFINPALVKTVYDKVVSLGKNAALVECNVLYKGSRVNRTVHLQTALEHGFDLPIDILDGENGEEYAEINGCKIGRGLKKYDSLIVLSHFKGHMETGFGGALKNIGMGLGSRAGKLYMHSAIKPNVIAEKCIACGICVAHCNAGAINLESGKAQINQDICEGCAMCIAYCDNQAINIPWEGRSADDMQKKMVEYAAAVLNEVPRAIFINVLEKITKHCDCMGIEQKQIINDVGILYSDDIAAVDQASLDLANKFSDGKFSQLHGKINYRTQIEHAESLGIGTSDYELIEV